MRTEANTELKIGYTPETEGPKILTAELWEHADFQSSLSSAAAIHGMDVESAGRSDQVQRQGIPHPSGPPLFSLAPMSGGHHTANMLITFGFYSKSGVDA